VDAAGNPEILERIRHMEYYLRYQWQRKFEELYGDLSDPAQLLAWNDFKCSIFTTNVLWNNDEASESIYDGAMGWTAYQNCMPTPPSPPSEAQAQQWMTEALAAMASENLIDVWPVPFDKDELVPINIIGKPLLFFDNLALRDGNFYVKIDQNYIDANNVLSLTVYSSGSVDSAPSITWYDPDDIQVLKTGTSFSPATPQQIDLPLSKPGVYRLKFSSFWCCGGSFTFEDWDVPVSLSSSSVWTANDINGYFYVPEGTSAFAVYHRVWFTYQPRLVLTDPDGVVVLDTTSLAGEKIIENPKPGIWKMERNHEGLDTMEIYGIPSLLWTDAENLLVPVSTLPAPVLTMVSVFPSSSSVLPGDTQQFTATGIDQIGRAMTITPVWSVDGGGVIDQSGLFTAGASEGGPFIVEAAVGAVSGNAGITIATVADIVWVEDTVPSGGSLFGTWNWISSAPAPFSGTLAHQSTLVAGTHQHYFNSATETLNIELGETLIAYIYLDPANPPTEVMLQWNDGDWEQRAYWGTNNIDWGTDGTDSRRYMGPLPTAGQWVRLEVPANLVGLEGSTLNGMAFTLFDGRATWDYAGKTI